MTRNVFDSPISVYQVKTWIGKDGKLAQTRGTHHVRSLGAFLCAGGHYKQTIMGARATLAALFDEYAAHGKTAKYDALCDEYALAKWVPPVGMLQGVCPTRNDSGFESYTDIICLDFDTQKPHKEPNGNEWVQSWGDVKNMLRDNPYIAYCGFSAGGRGLFAVVPIASHEQHIGHWLALKRLFRECYNLHVDDAAKNIGRLRFMSMDDTPIINRNARVFELAESMQKQTTPAPSARMAIAWAGDDTEAKIKRCVEQIERQHIDITASHDEWKKAGAAIAHYMGERGRAVHHAVCRQYPGYSEKECDRLFNNLMRGHSSSGADCDISTFFWLCSKHGITPGHTRNGARYAPIPVPVIKAPQRHQVAPNDTGRHNTPPTEKQSDSGGDNIN